MDPTKGGARPKYCRRSNKLRENVTIQLKINRNSLNDPLLFEGPFYFFTHLHFIISNILF